MDTISFQEKPRLRQPDLLIGFGGWANAGEASIGVLNYLKQGLRLKKFAEIDSKNYCDHTILRPSAVIKGGFIKDLRLPANEYFFFINNKSHHDLVIFQGIEPNLRWEEYTNTILDFAMEIEARGIYVIGGTYDRVLHTREPKVSAVATTQEIKDKILEWGFETTDYQGPCSIHTFLLFHCKERNIPALGMWGHTPLYLQKSPRVYQAILKKLVKILEIDLDLFNLEEASRELEKQIEVIINQNPEFKSFIKELEEDYQGEKKAHETPENIENVIRMEDFLKREKE